MPTETQHLEQRVAALQSDLNKKDEQIGALTFSDNDRELSRRSWFDEAKRLEKECEGLKADIRLLKSDLRIANDTVALGVKSLAERDALLEGFATELTLAITDSQVRSAMTAVGRSKIIQLLKDYNERIDAALSASAEPKSCGACANGCISGCQLEKDSPPSAPAERSPKDYAIEHAEYMAKSADDVLEKFQAYGLALMAVDEGGDDGEGELFEAIDDARGDLQESLVDLRSMVYEFRKRCARLSAKF
ncbi:hypothetical protein J4P02_22655 [Pseudomonas sp. NFXW11]|uniref:hypothetical protein n=1 Tax=Pseudomonas sp. NFXW11 TaxID=2819531 RepID=UPI003CECB225